MEVESLASILSEQAFFQELSPEHLDLIVGCASNVRFNPGEFIFRAGESADRFYIVRRGRVSVESYTPNRGAVTIETVGDGELLGWSWLIPPYSWHFDARALNLTRAIAFDGACLRAKCEADTSFGYELLKRISQIMVMRFEATRLQLMDLYAHV